MLQTINVNFVVFTENLASILNLIQNPKLSMIKPNKQKVTYFKISNNIYHHQFSDTLMIYIIKNLGFLLFLYRFL